MQREDLVFVWNETVPMPESQRCEFKEIKNENPIKSISGKIDQYVVAYLNASGGSIYWGIKDDCTVAGVKLTPTMQDELNQVVGQKVGSIAPFVKESQVNLIKHDVLPGKPRSSLQDVYVVEVRVRGLDGERLYITGSGESYKRTFGGIKKLTGAELREALYRELEEKKAKTRRNQDIYTNMDWMPSVQRRAEVVRPLLRGARILWVDDHPANNLYERTLLNSLGILVDSVTSTEEAAHMASHLALDLIISDMDRDCDPAAGLHLLKQIRQQGNGTPLIFYIGTIDTDRSAPVGAFGITNVPDGLLHLVFDVLERRS